MSRWLASAASLAAELPPVVERSRDDEFAPAAGVAFFNVNATSNRPGLEAATNSPVRVM
jgi:hypothetical protein